MVHTRSAQTPLPLPPPPPPLQVLWASLLNVYFHYVRWLLEILPLQQACGGRKRKPALGVLRPIRWIRPRLSFTPASSLLSGKHSPL